MVGYGREGKGRVGREALGLGRCGHRRGNRR